MPLYREEYFLIVHAGSEDTVFLFGLRDSLTPPQYKIPTLVYLDTTTNEYHLTNPAGSYQEIRPIRGSRIVDIGAFQALLKIIMQTIIEKHPVVTINLVPLLLVAPSLSYSREAVEAITKYVFEVLELTAFNIADLSTASAFGLGITSSSVVVNIGHESSQIMPVVNGTTLKYAGKRLSIGGKTIDDELQTLLPHLNGRQINALKKSRIFEVLNDHQDSFYSMADLNESTNNVPDELDVAKIITAEDQQNQEKSDEEEKPNSELQTNSFVDHDGKLISVGKERFQGTSKLIAALTEQIYECIERVPELDKRQECYDNIVFTGHTCDISGFKQAIIIKLIEDYLAKPQVTKKKSKTDSGVNSAIAAYQLTEETLEGPVEHNKLLQVPSTIKMAKIPDYFPEWKVPKETGGAWADVYILGAQIYAKQIYGTNSNHGGDSFIDTEIYEELGPLAIWDIIL
ncbi:hypothetical protein PUMCH_000542 [Australozyma saopauloensis]|uniref:Actin-like protein ARP9 n=1 Tax=Australozyma saopauloensis TaxID=291208 RepID=A0AAX4H418_9ASCO|nr:hypothetical protein PUMCH_000542 [[Candida] saopauloensis]